MEIVGILMLFGMTCLFGFVFIFWKENEFLNKMFESHSERLENLENWKRENEE